MWLLLHPKNIFCIPKAKMTDKEIEHVSRLIIQIVDMFKNQIIFLWQVQKLKLIIIMFFNDKNQYLPI
jgi:hypothetical protein